MRRLTYLIKEAFGNIRLNRTTTLIAVGTTGFTLASFGVFLLLYLNMRGVISSVQDTIQVALYLRDDLSSEEVSRLRNRLGSEPEVASVSFVSKGEALEEFREHFPADAYLLDGLGPNPLPASLVVAIAPGFRSSAAVTRWTERQRALPGVEHVQYNREWVKNLEALIVCLEFAAMAIGLLLSGASIAIIASTIKLTLYARREEIEIMKMIGATRTFIKVPYLIEGAILGAVGGMFSLLILRGGFELFTSRIQTSNPLLGIGADFAFLPTQMSLLLVGVGCMLGSTGSIVSLFRLEKAKS